MSYTPGISPADYDDDSSYYTGSSFSDARFGDSRRNSAPQEYGRPPEYGRPQGSSSRRNTLPPNYGSHLDPQSYGISGRHQTLLDGSAPARRNTHGRVPSSRSFLRPSDAYSESQFDSPMTSSSHLQGYDDVARRRVPGQVYGGNVRRGSIRSDRSGLPPVSPSRPSMMASRINLRRGQEFEADSRELIRQSITLNGDAGPLRVNMRRGEFHSREQFSVQGSSQDFIDDDHAYVGTEEVHQEHHRGMITGGRLPPGAEGSIAQNMTAGGTTPGGRKRPNRANTRLTDHSYGYHYEDDDAYGSILPEYDEGMVDPRLTQDNLGPLMQEFRTSSGDILQPHEVREYKIKKVCEEIDNAQKCVWCQCRPCALQWHHRRPSWRLMTLYLTVAIAQAGIVVFALTCTLIFALWNPLLVSSSMVGEKFHKEQNRSNR
jgi:hypothetical protein